MCTLGHAISSPKRVDHWLCLFVHCHKYCGREIPKTLKTRVGFGSRRLALDDLIDVGVSEEVLKRTPAGAPPAPGQHPHLCVTVLVLAHSASGF